MPRLARMVVPGAPHHVTQRGNRREPVFFEDGDQLRYLGFLTQAAERCGTAIWAYCLMPNHVHMIVMPRDRDGLRALFGDAHRRYTKFINWRYGWTGHLWQGRFGSVAMDEHHLASAVRYVALNPVRAGLVAKPEQWRFSSVHEHLAGKSDGLVDVRPVLDRFPDFRGLVDMPARPDEFVHLRKSETSDRPLGNEEWLAAIKRSN